MSLRLHFHGAARGVTGSCFLLEDGSARILVDCGLFQGSKTEKELNYRSFPFRPADITAVILTHAHIDHSGLIPKLCKAGYKGPVFATRATVDLCAVMLPDSGFIQEMEVEQLNRRNARRGLAGVEPIYTAEDAVRCLTQFRPVEYDAWTAVAAGVRARFWNAGHLLGSASVDVEIDAEGTGKPTRLLFSGDIGPGYKLLQFDPDAPKGVDYVIGEATYGSTDRQDVSPERRRAMLRDEVRSAMRPSGALLIPSFAVERTQELLVDLHGLMESGDLPQIPIFVDSPLATRASAVFERYAAEIEDGEKLRNALNAHNVHFTESVEQSKAIDRIRSFYIVIAASGMCEAGRIRHHLKAWLWRDDATVLLVGFQAQGTLGRILQEGASQVRLMGEEVRVRARIRTLDLYSGHADGPELAAWVQKRLLIAANLFLVHGEESALEGLKSRVAAFMPDENVIIPELDSAFELLPKGARRFETRRPARVSPESVGRLDWNNELSKLLLDISEKVSAAADERSKRIVIRRLRRALENGE
jgi:metallo-beta-lactamase family protein